MTWSDPNSTVSLLNILQEQKLFTEVIREGRETNSSKERLSYTMLRKREREGGLPSLLPFLTPSIQPRDKESVSLIKLQR
jgi:hypothetical protein